MINGRFLARPLTGVERYAREVITALDTKLDQLPNVVAPVTLLAPNGTKCDLPLKFITYATRGNARGHFWEQTTLAVVARNSILINLCNSAPLFHPNNFVVFHDAAVYRYPGDFSVLYRYYHQILGVGLARAASIGTVSSFSQRELAQTLNLDATSIPIIRNGSEHLASMKVAKLDAIAEIDLRETRFFLTVGTFSTRKNLDIVASALRRIDRHDFRVLVVGGTNKKIFGRANISPDPRLVILGRRSDAELAALYRNAVGLVFPSRYEGFGIPPLEAFSLGCPVIAASGPTTREICADAAEFFDPDDANGLSKIMMERLNEHSVKANWAEMGIKQANRYRWSEAAESLWRQMQILCSI